MGEGGGGELRGGGGGGGGGGAIDCTVVFRPRAIVFFKLDVFI